MARSDGALFDEHSLRCQFAWPTLVAVKSTGGAPFLIRMCRVDCAFRKKITLGNLAAIAALQADQIAHRLMDEFPGGMIRSVLMHGSGYVGLGLDLR